MIWTIAYWVLLVLGVAGGLRAMLWDRAGFRGRAELRCRKCWYDLTASPGEPHNVAIQCPECGKKHASRRAMRKTRRSKLWVVVALVLWMGAYGAGVWPRVSAHNYSNGVLGAVPTPMLILTLPLLSDEPGTIIDRGGTPYRKRPMDDRIAHQIKGRLYKADDTSLLDHWLFAKLARRESSALLTEKTALRGEVYSYVYNAWARQQRMMHEEERWARSVYFLELETPGMMPQMAPVHARVVAFRRLVDDRRVRVRIHEQTYETRSIGSRLVPVDRQYGERWDGTVRLKDYVRWPNFVGSSANQSIAVEGMIYEGDPYADIWWPVANIRENQVVDIAAVTYTGNGNIQSIEGIQFVEDLDQAESWLEEHFVASFEWDQNSIGDDLGWPMGIRFTVVAGELKKADLPGFTFGGSIWLVAKLRDRDGHVYAKKLNPSWWALRDHVDKNGKRVFDGDREWVPFTSDSRDGLGFRYVTEGSNIESMWIEIIPDDSSVGDGRFAAFWDIDMSLLFPNKIRLKIPGLDLRRLRNITDK